MSDTPEVHVSIVEIQLSQDLTQATMVAQVPRENAPFFRQIPYPLLNDTAIERFKQDVAAAVTNINTLTTKHVGSSKILLMPPPAAGGSRLVN